MFVEYLMNSYKHKYSIDNNYLSVVSYLFDYKIVEKLLIMYIYMFNRDKLIINIRDYIY